MPISSKNPIQGYVPCQICGKPSPTHYPKGGNRKHTLYYNCLEHKNQSGTGVGEYCEKHQLKTLLEYAQKYDAVDECAALQLELENAGLLATVIPKEEIEYVDDVEQEEQEPESEPLDTYEPKSTDLTVSEDTKEDTSEEESKGSGMGLLVLLLVFAVIGGTALVMVKKLIQTAPMPQPNAQPKDAPKPETQAAPEQAEPKQEGVLL